MAYPAAASRHRDRRGHRRQERHRAARRSARRAAPSRTTSSERSRPRLPRTEPSALSGARRHASGWPPSRGAHSGAPMQCRPACTRRRASIEDPGRRAVRTHRATALVAAKRYATRATAPSSTDQDRVHTEQDALTERTRCGAVFETAARTRRQRRSHPDAHLQERRRVQRLQPWEQEQEPTRSRSGRSPRRAAHSSSTHRVPRNLQTPRHDGPQRPSDQEACLQVPAE